MTLLIQILKMKIPNPVDYWNEMLKCERWRNLAQIALRIINIPPTEAACERMFSARREIMTKHISNIRDNVVEARAYLKAGLRSKKEEKEEIKSLIFFFNLKILL